MFTLLEHLDSPPFFFFFGFFLGGGGGGVARVAHLYNFLCWVFLFSFCFFLGGGGGIFCLRPASCVPNVPSFSGLSILDCHFSFI